MSDPWAEFLDEGAKKVSTARDVVLSGLSGVAQGQAQMLGFPGDVADLMQKGATKGVEFAEGRGVVPKGTSVLLAEALKAGSPSASAKGGRAAQILLSSALRTAGASPEVARAGGKLLPVPEALPPKTSDIETALQAQKQYHKPQTVPGEYARTVGQFVPAAAMPGSAVQRAANVVVPALASETAGQVTKNTKLEPYARVAGALLGAGAVTAATMPRPTTRILAESSRGATDDQILMAQALREDAARRGINLTQAEAVQQVTQNGTGLGETQRVLEATRGGGNVLGPTMAQRPDQVRNAVTSFADSISPPTADPYVLGRQGQEAAQGVLTDVRQSINANARPWYDALATERMPVASPAYQELVQSPAYAQALSDVRSNPILNAQIAQLPDDSLAVVNEVVKQLDTLAQNSMPNPAASTGSAQLSSAYSAARDTANQLASAVSEPWRLARTMVGSQREAFLEPIQAGPLGAISKTGDVQAQTRAMFPAAPAEGAANSTSQAMQMLPPETAAGLTRQHLVNSMNEATQNLQSGPNQWGGAKFAATVAGNPEQRATLMAGVEGAAPGQGEELRGLMEALEATGKRQAQGSKTAYNVEELRNLGEPGMAGQVLSTGLNPPGTFRRLGDAFQRWNLERNSRQLAEALIAEPGRATEIMMEARRSLPPGDQLNALERLAVSVGQGRQIERQPSRPLATP